MNFRDHAALVPSNDWSILQAAHQYHDLSPPEMNMQHKVVK